jgi:hypothetical protein
MAWRISAPSQGATARASGQGQRAIVQPKAMPAQAGQVRGAQRVHQRDRGVHFAHRHRVQPQAVGDGLAAIQREALAPAVEVFVLAQPPPHEVVPRQRQAQPYDQRIQCAQRAMAERLVHGGRIARGRSNVFR